MSEYVALYANGTDPDTKEKLVQAVSIGAFHEGRACIVEELTGRLIPCDEREGFLLCCREVDLSNRKDKLCEILDAMEGTT